MSDGPGSPPGDPFQAWPQEPVARRLPGRVALVTGGGGAGDFPGTGIAIAYLLARHGARVAVADIDAGRAKYTCARIAEFGGEAVPVIGDVTDREACGRLVAATVDTYGQLDVLVNNAGVSPGAAEAADPDGTWDQVMAINLTSARHMTVQAVPHLEQSASAAIVNIASIAGLRAFSSLSYAASKGGMVSLSRTSATVWGRAGIRVNCVAPGHIHTPMGYTSGEGLRELRRRATMLGTEGTAWDIAYAVLFLVSDESRWITGVTLPVDAGSVETTGLGAYRHMSAEPRPEW